MDDLISRQAAIDFIDAGRLVNPNEPRWSDNEVVAFLKSRPSAERRGKKKVYYHGENTFSYTCDQCNMPIDGKDEFCRWCGAKMEV